MCQSGSLQPQCPPQRWPQCVQGGSSLSTVTLRVIKPPPLSSVFAQIVTGQSLPFGGHSRVVLAVGDRVGAVVSLTSTVAVTVTAGFTPSLTTS